MKEGIAVQSAVWTVAEDPAKQLFAAPRGRGEAQGLLAL